MATQLELDLSPRLNLSLRYSFQVPVYSKSGKLRGYSLEHIVAGNRCGAEDLKDLPEFKNDINLLAEVWKSGAQKQIAKKHNVPEADLALVTFKGLSFAKHVPGPAPAAISEAWT